MRALSCFVLSVAVVAVVDALSIAAASSRPLIADVAAIFVDSVVDVAVNADNFVIALAVLPAVHVAAVRHFGAFVAGVPPGGA